MKTQLRQRLEIVFYAALTGFVGVSFGYYWAAAAAAEYIREVGK